MEVSGQCPALRPAARCQLGGRYPPVAVGVEPLLLLEGWNLRPVDDDVQRDPIRGNPYRGEVVDREVAEGVGGRDGRDDECKEEARCGCERAAAPAGAAAGPFAARPCRVGRSEVRVAWRHCNDSSDAWAFEAERGSRAPRMASDCWSRS